MSILSIYFLAFLVILIALYYSLPRSFSPYVILAGSVFFYAHFDYRYSVLLSGSIVCTYLGAIGIAKAKSITSKRLILSTVLILNIGLLFYVKFAQYLIDIAHNFLNTPSITVSVIVPLGIAFYTLQICGYCIDVYRGKYSPEYNIFKYASFASFFPLIMQGPISRYDQLSPTLFAARDRSKFYDNLTSGSQLMLWGFFKKLVIADRAALLVNAVFDNYHEYSGITIIIAILFYTLQIYTDFSGCVDICKGAAKTFGIEVMENFKQPYFSTSIQDFWRRWHLALSSWLKDYVYISLGGNRKGTLRKYINLVIVFLVSGLWHGVGVHYIVWGLMQAFFQIVGAVTLDFRKNLCKALNINRESKGFKAYQWLITFVMINLSWLVFRADGTMVAVNMVKSIFASSGTAELFPAISKGDVLVLAIATLVLAVIGYYREKGYSIRNAVASRPLAVRWCAYYGLFLIVLILGVYGPGYSDSAFIYMNF